MVPLKLSPVTTKCAVITCAPAGVDKLSSQEPVGEAVAVCGAAGAAARRALVPALFSVKTGRVSQPRTVDVDPIFALSRSTVQFGKRFSTSSSATRPSILASAAPRQA